MTLIFEIISKTVFPQWLRYNRKRSCLRDFAPKGRFQLLQQLNVNQTKGMKINVVILLQNITADECNRKIKLHTKEIGMGKE